MKQLVVAREYVEPCLTYLYRVFRLLFGASKHVTDKATRRRSQFLSILCVVFEIMYLVVVIWDPALIKYALAGIIIMVLSYILSRTRYTTTTKLLFIYGTTIWNLYMVVYTARTEEVSTALRLIGLPFSTMMIFMVAVLFKSFVHSLLHVLVLEIVYVTITLWASSTNTTINMVNTFRGTIMMGIMVVGFAAIATLDLAELHKHKQRFKTLFDLTGEAVFVCRDETIVDVNVSFESLFRCRRDDVIGKLTLRNILPDFPILLRTNSMSSQSPTEVIIETVDKVKLWAEVRVHTGVLEGNAVSVFTVTDITTRKQVQEAETRALRAAVANEAKNQFLATMSHEMRTPIAGVMSSVDLLDSTSLSKEQRSLIDLTRVCARSLLDTINDILDFTKIETGKLELDCTEVNLVKLVEDCVLIVCGNAHKKSLEIVTTVNGDVPMHVMGDSTRIKQVLLNFLSNAVKFTHVGQVLVHLSVVPLPASATPKSLEDKVSLKFTVSDSGIGINPKYFAKLFEPFGQLDTGNTRKYGGTGLGLSISRRFCEKMGGTVALVHSEEGKGSTFEFNIVLDKLKDDTLTHLGSEIGNALHESVGIGDTPEIASSTVTPNTAPPSPYQQPPPLSLSQSLPPSNSLSPTSQQSLTTTTLSPSVASQNPLFVSSSSSSISSASSSSSSLAIPEVWVALVLEPNKFTAQSLLHYCKLLSFHPDLSFAFDSPTDLLKFLAGGSARTTRKRTASHRGSTLPRRRVVLFAHTQYREAIERACAAGDATIADRVFAWVWITPAQGTSQRTVTQSGAFPQRMAALTKPIFFSDVARCMLHLFQPTVGGALSLWSSYFPDHLHNSLGRSGGNAEKFNRENITMSVGASLLPSVTSTPNLTPGFPPPTPSFPLSFSPSTPSLPPSEPPLIVSTYLPHPTENLHVYDPTLFSRAPLSPLDPHAHLPPSHYSTQRHHDLRATLAQDNYLRRQWGITQDSPDPAHAQHLYQNAARAAGVHPPDAQALRAAGAYPMHALSAQAPRAAYSMHALDAQHHAHATGDAQAPRTNDSRETTFTDSTSTASSDDFYYNNYHCHISSPSGVLSSSILTSSAIPSPHVSSPALIPSSPPLSSPPLLSALSPPASPPGVMELERTDGKEKRRESDATKSPEESATQAPHANRNNSQDSLPTNETNNTNSIANNNIPNSNNYSNNNSINNTSNSNISNEKNSSNMPFSHNNIHLYNKFINPLDYSKIEESPTISSTVFHRKDTKQRKILIVDDNIVIRKLLSKMLASCGFSTFTAPGGQQALDMLKGDPTIDLILLDIQMPEMDGYEVTRQIRQSEAGTSLHVPIIAITANAVSTERNHCLEVGMDDCLIKPVQKDFLLQILSFYLPPS